MATIPAELTAELHKLVEEAGSIINGITRDADQHAEKHGDDYRNICLRGIAIQCGKLKQRATNCKHIHENLNRPENENPRMKLTDYMELQELITDQECRIRKIEIYAKFIGSAFLGVAAFGVIWFLLWVGSFYGQVFK